MAHQITIGDRRKPSEELRALIEEFSFEDLVYCKLERFIERLPLDAENDLWETIVSSVESPLFRLVLAKCAFNKTLASKMLGINRATLAKKLTKLAIDTKSD